MPDIFKREQLTYGMIGGGNGAYIGDTHRRAIALEGDTRISSGCFSRDYENTKSTGIALGIDEQRLYTSYEEMALKEGARKDKLDFVIIVTPNNLHFDISKKFLEQGINVVCDKPLTLTVEEGLELKKIAQEKDLLFAVTYTYTGYPSVHEARHIISSGEIGDIRFIHAEYIQEGRASYVEANGGKRVMWKSDPKQSGIGGTLADIGTHIENMVSYMTSLEIDSVCARLDKMFPQRQLDDNASVMVNYKSGAKGIYWASQVIYGCTNNITIKVFGDKGGIIWQQLKPEELEVLKSDAPKTILYKGRDMKSDNAKKYARLNAGHPEGYFEAFSNVYIAYMEAIRKKKLGEKLTKEDIVFPTVDDGISGVRFIEKCVESSNNNSSWVSF